MAVWKTASGKNKYFNEDAKELLTRYILRPDKVIHGYWDGIHIDLLAPAESMETISAQFGKTQGVQLRHFIISFDPEELNRPEIAFNIAQQAAVYIGRKYQAIYAVHEDKPHLHIHLVQNSVSYVDGQRYYGTRAEFYALQDELRRILRQYHIYTLIYSPIRKT